MPNQDERARHRSPAYPALSLKSAIKKTGEFYEKQNDNLVSIRTAKSDWGYTEKSGAGDRCVAALLSFGLIEEIKKGADRKLKLSELGRQIILLKPDTHPKRLAALKKAALLPKIHRDLLKAYPKKLPSDAELGNFLNFEKRFNPKAVGPLISEWKVTFELANLADGAILDEEKEIKREVEGGHLDAKLPGGEGKVPETQTKTEFLDLPIPLISGGRAVLRMPIPLSEEDYELLTSMLSNTLKGMRKAIVRKDRERDPAE